MDQLSQTVSLWTMHHLLKCVSHIAHSQTDEAACPVSEVLAPSAYTYLNNLGRTSKSGSPVSMIGISKFSISAITALEPQGLQHCSNDLRVHTPVPAGELPEWVAETGQRCARQVQWYCVR